MAATKLQMGWSGVVVTPTGGTAIPITNVTKVHTKKGSQKKEFHGDTNPFAKLITTKNKTREVTITSGDMAAMLAIPEDTVCSLVYVFNDAKNGAGAGAITRTLNLAVLTEAPDEGAVNEFGMGTVTFSAYSLDGTDPLVTVVNPGP